MINRTGTATKRSLDNADNSSSQKKLRLQTPEEKFSYLTSLVRKCVWRKELEDLLKHIAYGKVFDKTFPQDPHAAFSTMLSQGDYDLFVTAFNMLHEVRANAALQAGGEPYKSSLLLSPPPHWSPPMAELQDVLGQVHVDILYVRPPQPATIDTPIPCLSASVSLVVATLLNSGTGELHLSGSFVEYDLIAHAVATSRLSGLVLCNKQEDTLHANDLQGYRKILAASASCSVLKDLALGRHEYLDLHALIGDLQKNGGPQLEALCLNMTDVSTSDPKLSAFMDMVGKIPTLKSFYISSLGIHDIDALEQAVLTPLAESRSLTKLTVHCSFHRTTSVQTLWLVAPKLKDFKARCPSLLHLYGRADFMPRKGLAGPLVDLHLALGVDLHAPGASSASTAQASQPHLDLHTFSLDGFPLSPKFCDTLFDWVASNRRLSQFNLENCLIHLPSAPRLTHALARNDTIETASIPLSLDHYYTTIKTPQGDRAIHFDFNGGGSITYHFHNAAQLLHSDVARVDVLGLHKSGKELFEASIQKPQENRRNAQRKMANTRLLGEGDLRQRSEGPLRQQPPGSHLVLQLHQLSDEQRQLFTAASGAIAKRDKTALAQAIASGAPLNVVDEQARNRLVVLAAQSGDPLLVNTLLDSRATDFGGHGLMATKSSEVMALLRPPETGLTTTTTTTNTTTTTTTATTTSDIWAIFPTASTGHELNEDTSSGDSGGSP